MKAVLIDDEPHNLRNLQALLSAYCPQVEVCAVALNAEAGRAALYAHRPELLFLDIQLPQQDGFTLLRSLATYDFEVIFVTAYDQYAIQAMRLAAVDYLLKPVDISELQAAVAKADRQRRLKAQSGQVEQLMQWLQSQSRTEAQTIALATTQETRFVRVSEIVRCESSNNYTTVVLADGTTVLVSKPIYEYDELLRGYGFLRCHQSHLVNKAFVRSWRKEYGDFLVMTDGNQVPISRGKKETVKRALQG